MVPPDANADQFRTAFTITVDLAVGTEHPILIKADGVALGVVTKRALLRGIQGRDEAVVEGEAA